MGAGPYHRTWLPIDTGNHVDVDPEIRTCGARMIVDDTTITHRHSEPDAKRKGGESRDDSHSRGSCLR